MRIVVLMSTYNGMRFLEEQVRSILAQLPEGGSLMVRDDGSTDGTPDWLERLGDPRIVLTRGRNIGFGASFLTLLMQVPADADVALFSDQDDVWLPYKIARSVSQLAQAGSRPALYSSAQQLVDEQLRPLGVSPRWPRGPSFSGAIAENIVTGCTAALNRPAIALLQRAGIPGMVRFHDWWIYLVISAFGTVIVDDEPTILYRQHGANEIGRGAGWWQRHVQIVAFLRRRDWVGMLLGQVHALNEHYGGDLPQAHRALLQRYFRFGRGHAAARWRLIMSVRQWRQSLGQEMMFRGLLLLHRFGLHPRWS